MATRKIGLTIPRKDWLRALMAQPYKEVEALALRLSKDYIVKDLALAQSGLAMLQLEDGALGTTFYLGEFPLARCELSLQLADGRQVMGAAQIMDDRVELAQALAILDAILAHQLPGCNEAQTLLNAGMKKIEDEETIRQGMLAQTRVDFSMLSVAQGEDDA